MIKIITIVISVALATGVLLAKINSMPTAGQVSVVVPNGEEVFIRGTANRISWAGGNDIVAVGLVQPEATTNFDIASAGLIVGWIFTTELEDGFYPTDGFLDWDGKEVCNLNFERNCKLVSPGKYKIIVWSEDANGSMYIASGKGKRGNYSPKDYRGNWDLSDKVFTIK